MSIGQAVGTVIGFVVGGPKGAYWGYMAGSIIDPPPGPHTEGPRLTDRVVQTSEEGAPLPTVFGTVRIAGNVIWSSGLEEIKHKEESGGGSGGGGATSTTYTYRTDAAIALCAGEIAGVRRIWADTKLIYDVSETADVSTLLASNSSAAGIRIYTGSETQDADPLIQAIEGAANTPAFRGMVYVVFEDLELADFGNRLPNFSFEVVKTGSQTCEVAKYLDTTDYAAVIYGKNTIVDEIGNTVTSYLASISTATSYYSCTSNTSIAISNGYLSIDGPFIFADDYTFEARVFVSQSTTSGFNHSLFDLRGTNSYVPGIFFISTGAGNLVYFNGATYSGTDIVMPNMWHHIAFSRHGGVLRAFLNGVVQFEINNTDILSTASIFIGKGWVIANGFPGYIEDILIAKYSKYTNNFTPSDYEFSIMQRIQAWTQNLETVCDDLIKNVVATAEYDMSALAADTVRGYVVGRPMPTRAALEPLQTAYHFDLSEVDGKIKAIKRGGSVVATIPADDLGAAESPDGVQLKLTRHNESELPSEIQISYSDIDNDHQAGTQYARSLTAQVTNIQQISLPLVMTSSEAARLAEVILNSARYTGRHTLEFNLSYAWTRLVPSDVVSVPGYGVQWTARIGQVDIGMPGLVQCQASPEIAALYASILAGSDPTGIGQTLGLSGVTTLNLLDCALLRDEDNSFGWYVALTGSVDTWPGGAVYKSNDGGATWTFAASATRTQGARLGSAAAALPNADCRVWDKTNTINVRLQADATLSSSTEASLLAGANSALLGATGRWEVIQFLTATLETDGSYTLSNLLRGRKGTEHAAGSHAAGDTFILLDAASLANLPAASAELNAARHYKALTLGQALEAVNATSHTYTGERLRCLSPVELGGGREASGNLTINWKRRDRINAGWNDYADIPMSETTQAYEVDLYTSNTYATLKRTITGLATPTASYTSAQQVTDYGGNQATVYARIYQISATTGRGHYLQGSI